MTIQDVTPVPATVNATVMKAARSEPVVEAPERRQAHLQLPVLLPANAKTAQIGKLMAESARVMADRVTTLWAEQRAGYVVQFDVTITEILPSDGV